MELEEILISLNRFYTEGHVGRVGFGFGFRGFLGYDMGNLGEKLGNDLDLNMKIGSEFYISSEIIEKANPILLGYYLFEINL